MEITEIFAKFGESTFRDYETRHWNLSCISTDASFPLAAAPSCARESALLKEIGLVVLLTAREEIIYDRVARNTKASAAQHRRSSRDHLADSRGAHFGIRRGGPSDGGHFGPHAGTSRGSRHFRGKKGRLAGRTLIES
jgi:shikimate kinase